MASLDRSTLPLTTGIPLEALRGIVLPRPSATPAGERHGDEPPVSASFGTWRVVVDSSGALVMAEAERPHAAARMTFKIWQLAVLLGQSLRSGVPRSLVVHGAAADARIQRLATGYIAGELKRRSPAVMTPGEGQSAA